MKYHNWLQITNKMILISLMIVCLSPFTAISVHSISIPKIATFEFFIDEYYVNNKAAKRVHLRCISNSVPAPIITFYKDGIEINNNLSRIERMINEEMFINNATYQQDDGLYRCTASNRNGRISEEKEIKIPTTGHFLPGAKVGDPLEITGVVIGRSIKIYCPEHSYTYPLEYKWVTQGPRGRLEFIGQNRRIHLLTGGKALFYSFITRQDVKSINGRGGVSCVLKTNNQLKISRKFKFKITGEAVMEDTEPQMIEYLAAKNFVTEGNNLDLKCAASGNPIPLVKWYRNGVELNVNDSTRYEINTLLPERLTLRNVRADMEGEYKCEFENRKGSIASRGSVYVARPPRIKQHFPEEIEKVLKKELRLQCDAYGTLPINFKWIRNGSKLTTSISEKRSIIVDGGLLRIKNISFDDQGIYQCIATSKYGQQSSVTRLVVKQPTGEITGNRSTNNNNNTHNNNGTISDQKTDEEKPLLELKYIIIIACGGTLFLVLTCGAIFMYCRSKKDYKQEQFIPTPKPGYNDYNRQQVDGPVYAQPDFSPGFTGYRDSDEDVASTFSGAKMNDPAFISLMSTLRQDKNIAPSENFYYEASDGKQSTTPSTEL